MSSIGNQNICQVKSIITLHGDEVVKKHILDSHKVDKELISKSKKEFDEPLSHEKIINSPSIPHFIKQ